MASLPHEAIETAQAMSKIQDIVKSFQPALEQYKSMLSSIPWDAINSAKALRDLQAHMPTFDASALDMRSSFTPEQIRQITDTYASIGDIVKSQYSGKSKKALSNFLDEVDKAQKEVIGSDEVSQIKTAAYSEQNTKTFTFEGILGQNCGNVVEPSPEDEKRIQVKGFKVNDGLRVLRGFAKSSDLAAISQADENYQRDKYPEHVAALSDFIQNIKTSAKYLPEVTLVSRGYEKLDKITLTGSLTEKQRFENVKNVFKVQNEEIIKNSNGNIKNNANNLNLAKTFLKFCYTEKALQDFTVETGIARALKYDLTSEQKAKLTSYARNVFEYRNRAEVIYNLSGNKIYMNNETKFVKEIWHATVKGEDYIGPYSAYRSSSNIDAKAYFKGLWINSETWISRYRQFFTWSD